MNIWNRDWFPLPGQAVFDRDQQQIAAVSRAPGNLDLFVIGFDNHVWTTFWNRAGGWNADWFPLPGQAVFDRDKQQIAAVSRAPGNLDLFVIGFDNHVWTHVLEPSAAAGTPTWFPLPGQAVFDRDKQQIAAVSRAPATWICSSSASTTTSGPRSGTRPTGWNADLVPAARAGGLRPREATDRRGLARSGQPGPVRHRLRQPRLDHVLERPPAGTLTGSRCPDRRSSTATSSRSRRSRELRATWTCSSSDSTTTSGPRSGTSRGWNA